MEALFKGLERNSKVNPSSESSIKLCSNLIVASKKKRLTFTFPFVHHQSHDWKVEHLIFDPPVIEIDRKADSFSGVPTGTRRLINLNCHQFKVTQLMSRVPVDP
jgi:hypothetical protein